ncbi:sugar transferase [Algoriphagus litoralis]|uniref:sugar transferase n=1 Tax=Algoriphagus litoralis TaxID=2202829 RepID=UPI000DBA98B3|nr:sugar transferase [Algoriphagus litoralis]
MITGNQHQEVIFNGFQNSAFLPDIFSFERINTGSISKNIADKINLSTRFAKRAFDILFSSMVILFGLPIFLMVAALTKITSKGPVFYKQERIGRNGKPFFIYKYRSMIVDAEANGPQLTTDDDPRITKWGKFMRKTHLDELPQFWNVLVGDMSVVGPRPEREHFIKQIVKKAPSYKNLLSLKPGITSIGQVDYGYAESVEEMCERMTLDLDYLKEVNLAKDLSIIVKTVGTMIYGKGK